MASCQYFDVHLKTHAEADTDNTVASRLLIFEMMNELIQTHPWFRVIFFSQSQPLFSTPAARVCARRAFRLDPLHVAVETSDALGNHRAEHRWPIRSTFLQFSETFLRENKGAVLQNRKSLIQRYRRDFSFRGGYLCLSPPWRACWWSQRMIFNRISEECASLILFRDAKPRMLP